jgi:hypothetical protein
MAAVAISILRMKNLLFVAGSPTLFRGPARLVPQTGGGQPDLGKVNELAFIFPQPASAAQHGISETLWR